MTQSKGRKMQREILRFALFVVGGLVVTATVGAEFEPPAGPTELSEGPISKFQPLIGHWEIDTTWEDGTALWAHNEYRVGMGGQFVVADTYAKDDDGKLYHRYHTVFAYDAEKKQFMSYGFTYDGTVKSLPCQVSNEDGKLSITSQWLTEGAFECKQSVVMIDDDSYKWTVWMRPHVGDEWIEAMVGVWKRVDP